MQTTTDTAAAGSPRPPTTSAPSASRGATCSPPSNALRPPTVAAARARSFLDQAAADDRIAAGPVVGRLPLVLREHPAPANLDALDAACQIERDLFDLADQVAAVVCNAPCAAARPPPTGPAWFGGSSTPPTATTPRAGTTSPPRRPAAAAGLRWASNWIEQRVTGEACGDLFARLGPAEAERVATVAARARRPLERALGRTGAPPCWTGRARGAPGITAARGPAVSRSSRAARARRARRPWRTTSGPGGTGAAPNSPGCTWR